MIAKFNYINTVVIFFLDKRESLKLDWVIGSPYLDYLNETHV
jgi:hypothetical protein